MDSFTIRGNQLLLAHGVREGHDDEKNVTVSIDAISGASGDKLNRLVLKLNVKKAYCESTSGSTCAVVIVILSSLSLLLLTAFALLVIMMLRKKPIKFLQFTNFKQQATDSADSEGRIAIQAQYR